MTSYADPETVMERAPETTSKSMSMTKAFAIVGGLLVAIGVAWALTKPDAPAEPATSLNSPPDFSLTDEEAIARFKELETLKIELYRTRDPSLISTVFADDSPSVPVVRRDLRELANAEVTFRSRYRTLRARVRSTNADEIRVEQQVLVEPRLIAKSGRDVTGSGRQAQTVLWVLRRETDTWLVYKTVVLAARKV